MSMHVIQCADYGGPYRGSFIPMLAALAREAGGRGYPTTFVFSEIARDRPWLAELDGLADVHFVRGAVTRRALTGNAMRELAANVSSRPGPAVIHTHFTSFDIPAALIRLRTRDVAVVWHEHGPLFDDRRTRLRNRARYLVLGPLVDRVLCVSPELAAALRARHAPARKLLEFPNAIDTNTFAPATASERRAARRSLSLPDDARVVLHFAWEWKLKGGDLMLAAAEILASEDEVVVLTLPGEQNQSVLGLEGHDNVRALPPTDDVKRLYAAADVFLSSSRFEGALPLAILEALACGLPVVVTELPVQRRLIEGLEGAVAVAHEPSAIAAGIRRMFSLSETQRAEHVRVARARFESFFALDGWARRLVDLYEAVLQARSLAPAT